MATLYLNGQLMNSEEAMVSVYDHGFLYGLGLFETFRTYNGHIFLLDRHLERLQAACKELAIPFTLTKGEISSIVEQLIIANQLDDAYIRLTVSAGIGELGLPTEDYTKPTIVIMVKSLPQTSEEQWAAGKTLQLLQTRRNTPEAALRYKSLHYMNNIVAKRELLSYSPHGKYSDGLMLSEHGWIAEGIVSNIFFVKDNVICTPHLSTGILPGITRQYVLELAVKLGYQVEEGYYTVEQLQQSSEIWMTSSIQELVPITKFINAEGKQFTLSNHTVGPICRQLTEHYRKHTITK